VLTLQRVLVLGFNEGSPFLDLQLVLVQRDPEKGVPGLTIMFVLVPRGWLVALPPEAGQVAATAGAAHGSLVARVSFPCLVSGSGGGGGSWLFDGGGGLRLLLWPNWG
jgi:hypothetical protein